MLDAIKSANIANNILILKDLFYLEGVVAHGRASSSLAFGTSIQRSPQSFSIAGFFWLLVIWCGFDVSERSNSHHK